MMEADDKMLLSINTAASSEVNLSPAHDAKVRVSNQPRQGHAEMIAH